MKPWEAALVWAIGVPLFIWALVVYSTRVWPG